MKKSTLPVLLFAAAMLVACDAGTAAVPGTTAASTDILTTTPISDPPSLSADETVASATTAPKTAVPSILYNVTLERTSDPAGETTYFDSSELETLTLGGLSVKAYLTEQTNYSDSERFTKTYRDEDGNQITLYENSESFYRRNYDFDSYADIPLKECEQHLVTEADYKEWVESYLSLYLPDIDFDTQTYYQYSCKTNYFYSGSGFGGATTVDFFYIPQEKEGKTTEVRRYTFQYQHYVKDLPTANRIIIETDGTGNILSIRYTHQDCDWESHPFVMEAVENSIAEFATAHESEITSSLKIASFDIESSLLSYSNNRFMLSLTVTFNLLGEEFPDDPFYEEVIYPQLEMITVTLPTPEDDAEE